MNRFNSRHRLGTITNNFIDKQNYHTRLASKEELGRCLEYKNCCHYNPYLHDPVPCDHKHDCCEEEVKEEVKEECKIEDIKIEMVKETVICESKIEWSIPFVENQEEEIKIDDIYFNEEVDFQMDRSNISIEIKEVPKGMTRLSLFKKSSSLKW